MFLQSVTAVPLCIRFKACMIEGNIILSTGSVICGHHLELHFFNTDVFLVYLVSCANSESKLSDIYDGFFYLKFLFLSPEFLDS